MKVESKFCVVSLEEVSALVKQDDILLQRSGKVYTKNLETDIFSKHFIFISIPNAFIQLRLGSQNRLRATTESRIVGV